MFYPIIVVALSILLFTSTSISSAASGLLFSDDFSSGSTTDPSLRATGSLASDVKYAFTSNSSGEVDVTGGVLDWTGATSANGNLSSGNGSQKWTFVDSGSTPYNWASELSGNAYEIRFSYRTAASHPLTFAISDNIQTGHWNADANANYDFAFGAYGANWQSGEDGSSQNTSGVSNNTTYEISIRVDESAGSVDVYVDDAFLVSRSIDFENSGRYFSFGEPTSYGGYIDNFAVTVVDPNGPRVSGNWSDPETWFDNSVPGMDVATNELDLTIPSGITVTLDTDVEVGQLLVNGTLTATASTVSLTADSVIVQGMGSSFELGTASSRYTGNFTLTLKGETTEAYTHGSHNLGARALLAMMGGTISLHGEDRTEWTHLAATANIGASSITVDGLTDWVSGDEIVIAPSRQVYDEFDQITINTVSYDSGSDTSTITFASGQSLNYFHLGEIQQHTRPAGANPQRTWTADLRAEVALLNRNITIESPVVTADSQHADYGFGGHIMVHGEMDHMGMTMPMGEAYIDGVALNRMGQMGVLGRYPFHWHMVLDSTQGGTIQQYIKDSLIKQSFNRVITVHGTDGALVDNNVGYVFVGHGIFLEDGSERFNTFTNNLIMGGKRPSLSVALLQSDLLSEPQNSAPAAFWITNPNNTFDYNVAAGSEGCGYWFALAEELLGLSKNEPYFSGLVPVEEPLGSFKGNKAHSIFMGFDIFDQVIDDPQNDFKRNFGWYNSSDHVFEDFTAYACREAIYCGLSHNENSPENNFFDNAVLIDNYINLMFAANLEIRNSLIKADSGYSLAVGDQTLYRYYDGPGRIVDSHLMGFDQPNSVVTREGGGAATYHAVHLEGITTDHAGLLPFTHSFGLYERPKIYSTIFYDADGLVSGSGSARSIVPDHPFLLTGNEVRPAEWQGFAHNTHRYANLHIYVLGSPISPAMVTRTKSGTPTAYSYGPEQTTWHQFPVIIDEDFLYTFELETLPSTRNELRIRNGFLNNRSEGRYVTRFKNFGTLPNVSVGYVGKPGGPVRVFSMSALNASTSTAYFVDSAGDLYLHFIDLEQYRIIWDSPPANWFMVETDGDGIVNSQELAQGTDMLTSSDANFEFDTAGDFGTWNSLQFISGATVSGGLLSGTSTGDSKIRNSSLDLDTDSVQSVLVRYKADTATTVPLFWSGTNGGESSSRKLKVSYTTPDEWQILIFDLSSHNGWSGITTGLRLDPIAGAGDFEIDWILFSDGDYDDDGLPDVLDVGADLDGDGLEGFRDTNSDNDFLADADDPDQNPRGFALMLETWSNVLGTTVASIPTGTAPDTVDYLSEFASESNIDNNYGLRLSGYLVPPTTGNYTFWIAGDDTTELWLTTTGDTLDPDGAVRIAYSNGWTAVQQWNKFSTQQSIVISLNAGQAYYIEALLKEKTGGDHVAVAWSGPGITQQVIDGEYLIPYTPAPKGSAYMETWNGVFGNTISSIPLTNLPSTEEEISILDQDSSSDYFGRRAIAYLHPAVSGDYTFWISGDDQTELWLSSDESESNKSRIAYANGFTGRKQWSKFTSQKSVTISLVAGERYYLEVRHKENIGAGHFSVAWELDSNPASINPTTIDGSYLSPWYREGFFSQDVGSPAISGSVVYDLELDQFLIKASGNDIWSSSDQFHFLDKTISGDVTLTAYVKSLEDTHAWAKSGLMIRETLDADAACAAILVTPQNGVSFLRRTTTGGNAAHQVTSGLTAPIWLKLSRVGNAFTAEYSNDGTTWTQVGTTQSVSLNAEVQVGAAVTSHTNSSTTESEIQYLRIQTDD